MTTQITDEIFLSSTDTTERNLEMRIYFHIGSDVLTVILENNSSSRALVNLLNDGPITINMNDYANMEKVGRLPEELPWNDESIQVGYGDVILYLGNSLVIYYDHNSWNFTKLGHILDVTQSELIAILGQASVEVTITLNP